MNQYNSRDIATKEDDFQPNEDENDGIQYYPMYLYQMSHFFLGPQSNKCMSYDTDTSSRTHYQDAIMIFPWTYQAICYTAIGYMIDF